MIRSIQKGFKNHGVLLTCDSFPSTLLFTSKSMGIPTTPSLLVRAGAEEVRSVKSERNRTGCCDNGGCCQEAEFTTAGTARRPICRLAAVAKARLIMVVNLSLYFQYK
jgi:hypothetical protein